MFAKTKIASAALVAVTLGATAIASSSQAQAHGWGWGGLGLGIATGVVIGAAVASTPHYVVAPARHCRLAPRYNGLGQFIGNAKVCSYY
jgi:hypothetical protein